MVDNRSVVATAQHDGFAFATFGLGRRLQARFRRLCVGGRNPPDGFTDHCVPACRADGSSGLIALARTSIEVCRRFLIPEPFRQEAHVVQGKGVLRVKLVRLTEILFCFIGLIMVERGDALEIESRGLLLLAGF